MEAQLKQKLTTAHRPPPSSQKKVRRMPKRVPPEVRSEGMCTVALMSHSQASFPENQARTAEERGTDFQELSGEFEPNRGEDSAHKGDNDKDDESVLDVSSDEELHKQKTKSKKPLRSRQLRMDIQSAQGKNVSKGGKNVKRKANETHKGL